VFFFAYYPGVKFKQTSRRRYTQNIGWTCDDAYRR